MTSQKEQREFAHFILELDSNKHSKIYDTIQPPTYTFLINLSSTSNKKVVDIEREYVNEEIKKLDEKFDGYVTKTWKKYKENNYSF